MTIPNEEMGQGPLRSLRLGEILGSSTPWALRSPIISGCPANPGSLSCFPRFQADRPSKGQFLADWADFWCGFVFMLGIPSPKFSGGWGVCSSQYGCFSCFLRKLKSLLSQVPPGSPILLQNLIDMCLGIQNQKELRAARQDFSFQTLFSAKNSCFSSILGILGQILPGSLRLLQILLYISLLCWIVKKNQAARQDLVHDEFNSGF